MKCSPGDVQLAHQHGVVCTPCVMMTQCVWQNRLLLANMASGGASRAESNLMMHVKTGFVEKNKAKKHLIAPKLVAAVVLASRLFEGSCLEALLPFC